MPWYALQTKSRHEQKVARRLQDQGARIYLPLHLVERTWSDRTKRLWMPLFSSYLFVQMKDYASESKPVLQVPGSFRFLWWVGKPAVVKEEEIQAIQQFLGDYEGLPMEVKLSLGDHAEITEGPLMQQSGIIVDLDKHKATLLLTSMHLKVQVSLPKAHLKVLGNGY